MMKVLFWTSLILLVYVYVGYPLFLLIINLFKKAKSYSRKDLNTDCLPTVSIIIAAYNEEEVIAKRIKNLLMQDYFKEKMEIIVASDGSSDRTVDIAKGYEKHDVKVLDFKQNRGRAAVHNDGVRMAKGAIVIFTDAETEFEKSFIKGIVGEFENSIVGASCGRVLFKTKESAISSSIGFYWKIETKIRMMENEAGIFASGTGASFAIRKELYTHMDDREDIDDSLPLHVVISGYKVTFSEQAIAYDIANATIRGEIKARVRMTSKGITGVIKRWGWRGWIKHPLVSWGLLSHKILRWFTPFFMLGAFISNFFLTGEGIFYKLTFLGQVAFYLIALTGFAGEVLKRNIPVASTIFSFCVANIGMGIGVIKGLMGKAPAAYKMTE